MATEYTDGLALQAMKNIFEYLPAAYELGAHDAVAREKMATASTMAGMAFANAFLGVCHSLAHKLGAYHHLPHGIANALLITDVMRFNAAGRYSNIFFIACNARPSVYSVAIMEAYASSACVSASIPEAAVSPLG